MTESVTARIDRILTESPIGLSAAAKLFGTFRVGRPTSPATLFRWCVDGVKLRDGRRVRLEHIRIGNRLLTSRAGMRPLSGSTTTRARHAIYTDALACRQEQCRRARGP